MRILIANDHASVDLKQRIYRHLEAQGHEILDLGVNSNTSMDYPDIVRKAVDKYREKTWDFGILLCGTGIGVSIAANKFFGIRCALVHDVLTAEMAKRHNNANFIALGSRINYFVSPEKIIDSFIAADFEKGRHQIRIDKIDEMERK